MTGPEFNGALDHWLDDVPDDDEDERTDAEREADELEAGEDAYFDHLDNAADRERD